jgi:hypothetical protein
MRGAKRKETVRTYVGLVQMIYGWHNMIYFLGYLYVSNVGVKEAFVYIQCTIIYSIDQEQSQ